jgi:acetyl esterase/lipase
LGIQRISGGGGVTVALTDQWAKYESTLKTPFETNALAFGLVPQNVPGIQQLAEGEFLLDNLSVKAVLPTVTHADVSYGPHPRQKFDFWRAPGTAPTPVLVFVHGGGWLGSDKNQYNGFRATVQRLHRRGVSAANVNYRYSSEAPLPAPVHDAARAIQYLRSKAADWGIDKTRFAATGDSAGGCTVLWLATHDDLADPQSADPVARESTRLCGVVASGAQTTIDPVVIRRDVYETALAHQMICRGAGFPDNKAMDAGYEKAKAIYYEFSPINHLSADDPPVWMNYYGPVTDPGEGIHSSRFGVIFKKRADEVGVTCHLNIQKNPELYPKVPEMWEFIFGVLKAEPVKK